MKRYSVTLLALLMCFGLLLSGCGGGQTTTSNEPQKNEPQKADAGKPVELNMVGEYPDKHPAVVNAFMPWAKSIEEKSGNKVKFTYYPPNTLVPMKDGYNSTVSGMVDIFAAPNLYTTEKFPEFALASFPFVAPGAEAGSLVLSELLKKFPQMQKRFEDTKLLWVWTGATSQIHTTKKLVKTLDDIKGLRIIGGDSYELDIIKALGANPIEMTPSDVYLALERGTADGVLLPIAPVRSMKISDVAKYHTILDLKAGTFYAVMNKEKFKGLPPDVQKLIEETTGEKLGQTVGKVIDQASIADAKWMKENGHTFYVLPETERQKWAEKIKPLVDTWLTKAEAKGVANAGEIYKEAVRLGEEIGKKTGRGYQE
ncbi:MAG: TRAP transporter substrate-binding protein [Peptococcaceae bacterium]|nr:TRAP transporter substrate-binding protein [Peptococcaceae bacterium]